MKMRRNFTQLMFGLPLCFGALFAMGTPSGESFENLTASGIRYEEGSFTGDAGFVWTFAGARSVRATYEYSGTSIGFGTDSLEFRQLEGRLPDTGMRRLSFVIGPYFSAGVAADRGVEVWLDDVLIGTYWLDSMDGFTEVNIDGLEYAESVQVRFVAAGPRQLVLDAIQWWPWAESDPADPPEEPEPPVDPVDPPTDTDPPEEPEPPVEPEPIPIPEVESNPWRSDVDFLSLLESILPNTVGFDSAMWDWAYAGERLDRLKALELWFEIESVRRLEWLFQAVWLLEGRYPARDEWSGEALFEAYLLNGDQESLMYGILYERPLARMRLGRYDPDRPAVFWNLLWMHWTGELPSVQQLVQMQYRLEVFAESTDSFEEALAAFVSSFVERRPLGGQPFVYQQPPAVFEEKLMERMLDALCGFDSFEQGWGVEWSYPYADLPVQLWGRLSSPAFLERIGLGPLGSVHVDGGHFWHPVYGWLWQPDAQSPWLFGEELGWFWNSLGLSGIGLWFWQQGLGWAWTDEGIFPWVVPAGNARPYRLSFSH